MCCVVTLATLVRMTVPVTDRKCPTSLDLGMVSLVSSGHTGRPGDTSLTMKQGVRVFSFILLLHTRWVYCLGPKDVPCQIRCIWTCKEFINLNKSVYSTHVDHVYMAVFGMTHKECA